MGNLKIHASFLFFFLISQFMFIRYTWQHSHRSVSQRTHWKNQFPILLFHILILKRWQNSLQFYKKKVSIDLYYYDLSMTYHLKGSNWIFVQEAKIQLLEKPRENRKIWQNYQRIMSLLQSFIDKNRVNVS